jgi:redox-sensing transcriptional repressor
MGIKSYWNFSHYDITSKFPDTIVENVHLSDKLMTLCYRMTN